MIYAQKEDLDERLGSELLVLLADEDGDGSADPSILDAVLSDADAEINAALGGRYATPIAPVPPVLVRLAIDLAIYFLFIRRREAISPEHLERWKVAREYLDSIARGETRLEDIPEKLGTESSESTTRKQTKHFDRESLDNF